MRCRSMMLILASHLLLFVVGRKYRSSVAISIGVAPAWSIFWMVGARIWRCADHSLRAAFVIATIAIARR